jgi:triacylglycerol esterase/lipase EstA (alpha/beta hydrolase family)
MHPIVLAHGFFGFAEMAGIDYFRNVKKYLEKQFSDLDVIVTEVAPNDLIDQRARQLWDQIDRIGQKVHIIGHSMGGLDSRFLLSPEGLDKSERIVSLTTLSTPHLGSPVADFIIDKCEIFKDLDIDPLTKALPKLDRVTKKIMKAMKREREVWRYLVELLNFSTKGMENLTTTHLKQFNQEYPDAPEVRYRSYAGVSGPNEEDYLPPIMYITWAIVFLNKDVDTGGRNDGLVAANAAQWGDFRGEIPADHFKLVGWDLSGWAWLRKLFPCFRTFNHLEFFKNIVRDLRILEEDLNA